VARNDSTSVAVGTAINADFVSVTARSQLALSLPSRQSLGTISPGAGAFTRRAQDRAPKRAPNPSDLLVLAHRLLSRSEISPTGCRRTFEGAGTTQVLNLIPKQLGIAANALAASWGLPSSYAFEIALDLQSAGAIGVKRAGWHRVVEMPCQVEKR